MEQTIRSTTQIHEMLNSQYPIDRLKGVMYVCANQVNDAETISMVYRLEDDAEVIMGRPVGAFATAALHILKGEMYHGRNDNVRFAIEVIKTAV